MNLASSKSHSTPSRGVGTENEGGSNGNANMESAHDARTPVPGPRDKGYSSGDGMMSIDAGAVPGPEEGGWDRDSRMEDRDSCPELRTTVPGLQGKGYSNGDGMMSADRSGPEPEDEGGLDRDVQMEDRESLPEAMTPTLRPRPPITPSHEVAPEDEGGSGGDANMEDGESHPESRAPALGPEDRAYSGGAGMMSADTRIAQEPEDEGHSCRDGPEDQGHPGADAIMIDTESNVPRVPGVTSTHCNRDDSAGNEAQIPAETRFSNRLREAATSAAASKPPVAPEGELDEDNRKRPTDSGRGKKKKGVTRQKRPSMPLGLGEVIDVDALVRLCSDVNLIDPNFSFRKTE